MPEGTGHGFEVDVPGSLDGLKSGYTPLQFLEAAMREPLLDIKERIRASIAAAQYVHVKKGEGGKKDVAQEAAEKTSSGSKFTPAAPPLKRVK